MTDRVSAALQRVMIAARRRREADLEYRDALHVARTAGHSLAEIGKAAGVTRYAIQHIVRPRDRRKKEA